MTPPIDISLLTAATLASALRALPYRTSAFLVTRLVQDRSGEACAALYGISASALHVHLLRAGLELTRRLGYPDRPPASDVEEEVWARALAEALEHEGTRVTPALTDTVKACRRLRTLGPAVAAALEATEREEERSPKRRREDLFRRLAVLVLLALTAWLYFNRPAEPERTVQPRAPTR